MQLTKPPIEFVPHDARRNNATIFYLRLGSLIPIVFFLTTMFCGFVLGDYNHLTRMVSELGALGTSSQFLFSTGLLVSSALSILFVVGLYRACRIAGISALPALIILCYSISIAGAAVFPLPLRLHLIVGMPSILLVLSPVLSLFLWGTSRHLSHIKVMSVLSFLVMSLGFLAFIPEILAGYPGLKQRIFHVGWSIWFVYLAYVFASHLRRMQDAEGEYVPPGISGAARM
jgi:hypothetical membrane protein